MKAATQRDKIWAILRYEDNWLGALDILRIAHSLPDGKINRIAITTIRRCLQELLARNMVKKDWRNPELPLWLGVPPGEFNVD